MLNDVKSSNKTLENISNDIREVFKKKNREFFTPKKKKKKLPKCVSGHLESFKTHLFLGEKGGYPHSSTFLAQIS